MPMAIRSIAELFKANRWSQELVAHIGEMLDLAAEMFAYAVEIIVYGAPDENSQADIYDRDIRINELEREIRRRVVARLSLEAPQPEIPSALIFMNAVKDVERIGDYMKNFYEVSHLLPDGVDRKMYQEYLVGRSRTLEDLFELTSQAFSESDESKARDLIKRARTLCKQAEELITDLAHKPLATNDAVCLVLIVRFYKRIAAHLMNVATSVVMPVELLDFYDEPEMLE
jgi:phosphate transport system protein